jgi:hypothetical protein
MDAAQSRQPHRPTPEDIENSKRKLIHCKGCHDWFYYLDAHVHEAEVAPGGRWDRWVNCPCGARRVISISDGPRAASALVPDSICVAEPAPVEKPAEDFYTAEERIDMLRKMRAASDAFYWAAFHARCHSFIEFAGFMNEFIALCAEAQEQGVDWTQSSVHNQAATLPMQPWHAKYLGEKFGCIFAGTFAKRPELYAIFIEALREG